MSQTFMQKTKKFKSIIKDQRRSWQEETRFKFSCKLMRFEKSALDSENDETYLAFRYWMHNDTKGTFYNSLNNLDDAHERLVANVTDLVFEKDPRESYQLTIQHHQ